MEEGKCYDPLMTITVTLMVKSLSQINVNGNHWPRKMIPQGTTEEAYCLPGCCWGNSSLLYPLDLFIPLVTSEDEVELDIPVCCDQPLTCLGDWHFFFSPCTVQFGFTGAAGVPGCIHCAEKLGALSPEMWGERGLRRLPCWVMDASFFPSRRERSRLG